MRTRRIARLASATVFVLALSVPVAAPAKAALLTLPINDSYTTGFEERLEVDEPGILGNDVSVGSGRAQLTNDVDHGNLNLNHDGGFQYDPDDGFSGTDTFRYRITGLISTQATVTITVQGTGSDADSHANANADPDTDSHADRRLPRRPRHRSPHRRRG